MDSQHFGTIAVMQRISPSGIHDVDRQEWMRPPVHGEFLFMPRLAFGITRDNVSAGDILSSLTASIPELQSAFVLPEQNASMSVVIILKRN